MRRSSYNNGPSGGHAFLIKSVKHQYSLVTGALKGDSKVNNLQKNAITVVAKELKMDPESVKQRLAEGEYLNDSSLLQLGRKNACKDFFEAAQKVNRVLARDLIAMGFSREAIKAAISILVMTMFDDFKAAPKSLTLTRWLRANIRRNGRRRKQSGEMFGKPIKAGPIPAARSEEHSRGRNETPELHAALQEAKENLTGLIEGNANPRQANKELRRLIEHLSGLYSAVLHREITGGRDLWAN